MLYMHSQKWADLVITMQPKDLSDNYLDKAHTFQYSQI